MAGTERDTVQCVRPDATIPKVEMLRRADHSIQHKCILVFLCSFDATL